eukprot:2568651-Amphidinium_carterae.1
MSSSLRAPAQRGTKRTSMALLSAGTKPARVQTHDQTGSPLSIDTCPEDTEPLNITVNCQSVPPTQLPILAVGLPRHSKSNTMLRQACIVAPLATASTSLPLLPFLPIPTSVDVP